MSDIPASTSPEGICNLALGHLKITKQITVLDSDKSLEAQGCRLFYDVCRKKVNSDFKWPFATVQAALSLIEDNPFPYDSCSDSEYAFAYQYPSDCMNFVRIVSGIRNETRSERIPFRVMAGAGGQMILTDLENARGEYTKEMTAEDSFSANYVLALSLLLAVYIAPMVTGGDPFKLGSRAMDLYKMEIEQAKANAINEEQIDREPDSELIQVRGYTNQPWVRRR